jgi:hypothetical protein
MKGTGPIDDPVLAEALADSQAGNLDTKAAKGLSTLAMELAEKVRYHNELITKLKENEVEITRLETRDIPAAMIDLGMKNFELLDGSKISFGKKYYAGIRVDNRSDAFKWMRESGNEALIKAEVQIPFGKGDVEAADKLRVAIKKLIEQRNAKLAEDLAKAEAEGDDAEVLRLKAEITLYQVPINLEQSVHWQTLRAWAREQVIEEERKIEDKELDPVKDKDKLLPRELLGIYVQDVAEISIKKLKLKKDDE